MLIRLIMDYRGLCAAFSPPLEAREPIVNQLLLSSQNFLAHTCSLSSSRYQNEIALEAGAQHIPGRNVAAVLMEVWVRARSRMCSFAVLRQGTLPVLDDEPACLPGVRYWEVKRSQESVFHPLGEPPILLWW